MISYGCSNDAMQQALAQIARESAAARRRQRYVAGTLALACVVSLFGWTLSAQQPKTIDERVTSLEKRLVGSSGNDGVTRFTAPFQITDRAGRVRDVRRDAARWCRLMLRRRSQRGQCIPRRRQIRRRLYRCRYTTNGNTGAALGQFAGGPMGVRVFGPDGINGAGESGVGPDQPRTTATWRCQLRFCRSRSRPNRVWFRQRGRR